MILFNLLWPFFKLHIAYLDHLNRWRVEYYDNYSANRFIPSPVDLEFNSKEELLSYIYSFPDYEIFHDDDL